MKELPCRAATVKSNPGLRQSSSGKWPKLRPAKLQKTPGTCRFNFSVLMELALSEGPELFIAIRSM